MALWYLVNGTRLKGPTGAVYLRAGELIDDTKGFSVATINAAGGILAPNTYPTVAAQAAFVQQRVRRGGLAETDADRIMMAAYSADFVATQQNRSIQTNAAGQTVAAGATIVPNVVFTPKVSGKVKIMAWVSIQALAAGTFTPVLKQGATTIVAPAKTTGAASQTPTHLYIEHEVDGLTIGQAVTFSFVTTAGDATVTLGNGATGISGRMEVQEMF